MADGIITQETSSMEDLFAKGAEFQETNKE